MNKRKIVAKAARYTLGATIVIPILTISAVQWLANKIVDGCDAILTNGLVLAKKIRANIDAWEDNVPETTFDILKNK